MQVSTRTLDDLGFTEVLRALSQRCRTDMGRERALARPFYETHQEVTDALDHVEEARRLLQQKISLPLGGVADVRPALALAEKQALIEPRELLAISRLLFAFLRTRELLEERDEHVPRLTSLARRLPMLESLAVRIDRCFEADGEISDRASPELKTARDRVRGLHRSIKSKLDDLLHDEKFLTNLREAYYSIRNGRYVVPVLSQMRNEVPGIVHNASQTGQTLFVEPEPMINLGNDLAIAQSVVLEEERRVLQELTDAVGRDAQRILQGVELLGALDEYEAAGILSADLDASAPVVSQEGTLELRGLRHPRLVLNGNRVVANDVLLTGDARALVVSGPNAGGKTITLTAVGLCALMLRAGLPIPADVGSKLPLYASIHSAVGDAQDLAQGLSTFSAHVVELRDISTAARRGSLVMIDEIAADTDPREGAAIATAVLEDLIERGATVLVTTHLEELKALAHVDPRFVNARVGFDPKKMAPTFRLQIGASGTSSAIEMAQRMGLSERVCVRARELALGTAGSLSRALAATEDERRRAEAEREKLEHAAAEAERLRALLERERGDFERRRKEEQLKYFEGVRVATEQAAAEVSDLLEKLRAGAKEKALAEAKAALAARAEEARKRAAETRSQLRPTHDAAPSGFELRVGGWVHHSGFDRDVEILELTANDALVAAGALKMRVPRSELSPARKGRPQTKFPTGDRKGASIQRAEGAAAAPVDITRYRFDVRGMRGDEAIGEVEQFLDRGLQQGEEGALIVHGHGTGALKQTIREYLDRSPYVRMYRPGDSHEGGDGVTVVAFKT